MNSIPATEELALLALRAAWIVSWKEPVGKFATPSKKLDWDVLCTKHFTSEPLKHINICITCLINNVSVGDHVQMNLQHLNESTRSTNFPLRC